jgi:DHA1 family multidrug resistance protein-like MFS transporter
MWSIVQSRKIGQGVNYYCRKPQTQHHVPQAAGEPSIGLDIPITFQDSTSSDEHADPFSVECTSDNDPINPQNWPLTLRAKTMAILCLLVFVQAWAGSSDSLANMKASKQYHVSPVAEDLTTAMYLFGIGTGCLFVGPLSMSFGRNPVYLSFSFGYLCFLLGTALSNNFATQIVCRFFAGLSSSATLGINGASVRDMFRPVDRTLWFPLIAWVNLVRKYPLLESNKAMKD